MSIYVVHKAKPRDRGSRPEGNRGGNARFSRGRY